MSAALNLIDANNPHTVYCNGYHIDYWIAGKACGMNDEWDYCYFRAWTKQGPTEFKVDNKIEYNRIIRVLDRVYELGQDKAKEDLRKFLNIKDN